MLKHERLKFVLTQIIRNITDTVPQHARFVYYCTVLHGVDKNLELYYE